MKVILIDEIRGLGGRGDVVTVKEGYARNFLLPKNLAREATPGNLKSIEHERKKWALLANQEQEVARKAAESVQGTKVVVRKRVGEHGHLFGSVTANEIADALVAKGVEIDKRRIELGHPIKTIGVHDIDVRLHKDVFAHIQVEVLPLGEERFEEKPVEKPVEKPAEKAAP
ncbi:MAG TPA: 50S ribosomal protein L9 [Thermoanaerobaculia bacterium]|nr:50S ribosomal protein L9 [Thermoanaerobaculia bacterium]